MPGIQDAIAAIMANQAGEEKGAPVPNMPAGPGMTKLPERESAPVHQPIDKGAFLMALKALMQMLSSVKNEDKALPKQMNTEPEEGEVDNG